MSAQAGVVRGGSLVAGIRVHVLKGEQHYLTSQVTQYPVESGKNISDHVTLNPNAVDMRFEMVNSGGGERDARSVFQEFIKLRDQRMPINIYTEHAQYKNMLIVAFTPDHRAPFKGAYAANVRLQQVGITNVSDMVSATGGRPAGVLAQDGTQATACAAEVSGEQPAITSGPVLGKCENKLRSMSA